MTQEEISNKLAALLYHEQRKKGAPAWEAVSAEVALPFTSLAAHLLDSLDKLNLRAAPKTAPFNDALVKARCESVVKDFFDRVKVWKKDLIPQAELVSIIFSLLKEGQQK